LGEEGGEEDCARGPGIHALIALGLLGELGQVDSIFVTHFGGWTGICEERLD